MNTTRRLRWIAAAFAVLTPLAVFPAVAETLASFDAVRERRVETAGFTMAREGDVTVTALSFGYRSSGASVTLTNAWILDAGTREPVWEMRDARDQWKTKRLTEETYRVHLAAGTYELYYSTHPDVRERWHNGGDWMGYVFGRGHRGAVERMLDAEDFDEVDDAYARMWLRVEGDGRKLDEAALRESQDRAAAGAVVALRRQGDHAYVNQGFSVDRPMRVHVYAVGESRNDGDYDYAWIVNADTRERVWRFTFDDTDHAGGAAKNRVVDSVFEVPAGRYVAYYATDGSHSFDRWNQPPPYDPAAWGIIVSTVEADDRSHAKRFDYTDEKWKNTVVEIVEAGDGVLETKGFSLAKPMTLRVYALGEGTGNRMYDYGWIVDARTRERVWEMKYRDTERAGGAEKNRLFDGTIELEKGDYIVYYATDGSHSYEEWNSAPPPDRHRWGITLAGTDDFDARAVSSFEDKGGEDVLASIVEVHDGEYEHRDFELKKETKLLVYAVGEGVDDRMYDYGWIEDAKTGRVVWEMTYWKTEHAGGAEKNRMFNGTITLDPGQYRLYYESDSSHSYGDWNAARPYDPHAWGISVRPVPNG